MVEAIWSKQLSSDSQYSHLSMRRSRMPAFVMDLVLQCIFWTLALTTAAPASSSVSRRSTKINTSFQPDYHTCPSDTTISRNLRPLKYLIQNEYASVIAPAMSEGTGTDNKLSSMDHAEVHYFNR